MINIRCRKPAVPITPRCSHLKNNESKKDLLLQADFIYRLLRSVYYTILLLFYNTLLTIREC